MLYLGPLSGDLMRLQHPSLGCMRTPESNRRLPLGMPWAADCGLSVATSNDPAAVDRYLGWLQAVAADRATCLFATAPDVLGDAEATWERSAPLLPLIRGLGYRAALVAQDGFDPEAVDWDAFDCLFIGGAPLTGDRLTPPNERRRRVGQEWKRREDGGWAAIREAHRRGLPVHVGRVNSGPYLRNLAAAGVRSADGTTLTWRNLQARAFGWLDRLHGQASLLESVS